MESKMGKEKTQQITDEQVDEITEQIVNNFTTDLLYDYELSMSGNCVEVDDVSVDEDGLKEVVRDAIAYVLGINSKYKIGKNKKK